MKKWLEDSKIPSKLILDSAVGYATQNIAYCLLSVWLFCLNKQTTVTNSQNIVQHAPIICCDTILCGNLCLCSVTCMDQSCSALTYKNHVVMYVVLSNS